MKVLALELSSKRGSVAIVHDGNEIFTREFSNDRHNSADFFSAVSAAREGCASLDRIAVGLGPGSYAGTRIAISTAIGLQLATSARLVGLPSFCAFDVPEREYGAVGDARRSSFWFAIVRETVCLAMPELMSESELRERTESGIPPPYSAESLSLFPNVRCTFPSALRLARIASADHPNASAPPLQPMYLREAHITISKQPVWREEK